MCRSFKFGTHDDSCGYLLLQRPYCKALATTHIIPPLLGVGIENSRSRIITMPDLLSQLLNAAGSTDDNQAGPVSLHVSLLDLILVGTVQDSLMHINFNWLQTLPNASLQALLSQPEAERMIEQLKTWELADVGTARWQTQRDWIGRMNLQVRVVLMPCRQGRTFALVYTAPISTFDYWMGWKNMFWISSFSVHSGSQVHTGYPGVHYIPRIAGTYKCKHSFWRVHCRAAGIPWQDAVAGARLVSYWGGCTQQHGASILYALCTN